MTTEQRPPQGSSARTTAMHGLVNLDMRRYDEALADCNRAIELDPASTSAITARGATYVRMRRYGKALADVKRYVRISSTADHHPQSNGKSRSD